MPTCLIMAKRFTDTDQWDKEWFMQLPCRLKCLVQFVRSKCDLCGVWSPNWIITNSYIGEPVNELELLQIDNGQQFHTDRKSKTDRGHCNFIQTHQPNAQQQKENHKSFKMKIACEFQDDEWIEGEEQCALRGKLKTTQQFYY